MIVDSLRAGITAVRRRPGLVFLLYGVNLAVAFVLAMPLYSALSATVGATGFGPDLARGFDLVLWTDVMEQVRVVFGALWAQLFWMVPLYLVWRTAAGVGMVYALSGEGTASFWEGVGRFTGRGLLLTLGYALLLAGLFVVTGIAYAIVAGVARGEVALVWWNAFLLPLLFATGFALLDLMQDYAQIALVTDERRVREAFRIGLGWPFRHGRAVVLYAAWLLPAGLLLAVPTALDTLLPAATATSVWLLFLLQQAFLVMRAAVTQGWIGSEVAFFQTILATEPLPIPLASAPSVPDASPAGSEAVEDEAIASEETPSIRGSDSTAAQEEIRPSAG